jgi:hypothetical protein
LAWLIGLRKAPRWSVVEPELSPASIAGLFGSKACLGRSAVVGERREQGVLIEEIAGSVAGDWERAMPMRL